MTSFHWLLLALAALVIILQIRPWDFTEKTVEEELLDALLPQHGGHR